MQPNDKTSLFPVTLWSAIHRWQQGDEIAKCLALEQLLPRYQRPIQVRIQGILRCQPDQAKELTQQFFLQCLRREFLASVQPGANSRFRYFVKACLKRFLWDFALHEMTEKERVLNEALRIDQPTEGGAPLLQLAADAPIQDELLDLEWALEVLNRSLGRLEEECAEQRQRTLFKVLRSALSGSTSDETYAALATRLKLSEANVKVISFRMRKRLGQLIAEEIQQTVGSVADWQEELRYLIDLLGKHGGHVTSDETNRLVSIL